MGQKHKSYYLFNNLAGNTTIHDLFEEGCSRQMCWDEENRLAGFSDHCKNTGFYQYDAGGKRTYKLTGGYAAQNIQGHWWSYNLLDNPTLYASSYVVATPQGYTKHYYAEAERITSQLGKGQFADVGTPMVSDSLVQVKQHLHYLPWGETYVDQKSNRFDGVRYTFSAKEKDTETGLSYFGARYYSSDLSVWISVDPMSDIYPSMSPYNYCANNPVKLVDPNGEKVVITGTAADDYVSRLNTENVKFYRTEDGILHYEGTAVTSTEKQMISAITDQYVTVNICAENTSSIDNVGGVSVDAKTRGGSFLGTVYENGKVNSYQQVNPEKLKQFGKDIGVGSGMYERHELTEGYEAGRLSLYLQYSSPRAGLPNSLYDDAHNKASFAYDLIETSIPVSFPTIEKFGFPNFLKINHTVLYKYSIDNHED